MDGTNQRGEVIASGIAEVVLPHPMMSILDVRRYPRRATASAGTRCGTSWTGTASV